MKLVIHTDWLRVYDNVLSKADCNHLIQYGKQHSWRKSTTVGKKIEGYRTSSECAIREPFHSDVILSKIIEDVSGYSILNQELTSLLKYEPGETYRPHKDWFNEYSVEGRKMIGNRGNRVMSAILFLNDNFTGGQTQFYNEDGSPEITVHPKRGRLLLWMNMNIIYNYGQVVKRKNHKSMHSGLPVISGTKYCAVKWIRETIPNKELTNELNRTTTSG